MNRPVVVSDSGPLIALASCSQLKLLVAVFDVIHVPQVVLDETTADRSRPGASDIVTFVQAHAHVCPSREDAAYIAMTAYLDDGEAQALSLAQALGCGVLLQGKRIGKIKYIAPALIQMQMNGCRISQALVDETLRLAGEVS